MKRPYKLVPILFFVILIFGGLKAYSQNMLQDDPTTSMREMAQEEVQYWHDELALTEKQAMLMENKLIEFQIQKEELLQSKMQEEEKTIRLERLQQLENADMRNILTKPQYERYLQLLEDRLRNRLNED